MKEYFSGIGVFSSDFKLELLSLIDKDCYQYIYIFFLKKEIKRK